MALGAQSRAKARLMSKRPASALDADGIEVKSDPTTSADPLSEVQPTQIDIDAGVGDVLAASHISPRST